jgi:hypothetical protein
MTERPTAEPMDAMEEQGERKEREYSAEQDDRNSDMQAGAVFLFSDFAVRLLGRMTIAIATAINEGFFPFMLFGLDFLLYSGIDLWCGAMLLSGYRKWRSYSVVLALLIILGNGVRAFGIMAMEGMQTTALLAIAGQISFAASILLVLTGQVSRLRIRIATVVFVGGYAVCTLLSVVFGLFARGLL